MGNQPLFDLRESHSIYGIFLRVSIRVNIKSKEEDKCQESIQLVPYLTQNTIWESDKRTSKRHIQKSLEVSSDSGPSPCISK